MNCSKINIYNVVIYIIFGFVFYKVFSSVTNYLNIFYDFIIYIEMFLYLVLGLFLLVNKSYCKWIYLLMVLGIMLARYKNTGYNFNLYLDKWLPLLFKDKTVFINVIGNIVLFIPLGAFFNKNIYLSFIIVIILEITQFLLLRGVFDITDIILNFLGVLIGFVGVKIWQKKKK